MTHRRDPVALCSPSSSSAASGGVQQADGGGSRQRNGRPGEDRGGDRRHDSRRRARDGLVPSGSGRRTGGRRARGGADRRDPARRRRSRQSVARCWSASKFRRSAAELQRQAGRGHPRPGGARQRERRPGRAPASCSIAASPRARKSRARGPRSPNREAVRAEAQASLASAETVAGRPIVHATFDGIVASVCTTPEISSSRPPATPVLLVIDLGRLEVVALGAARRCARESKAGAPAALVPPSSDSARGLEGHLAAPARRRRRVRPRSRCAWPSPRPANIPSARRSQVEIEAEQRSDVVLVPAAAIGPRGRERRRSSSPTDGKAQRRPIADRARRRDARRDPSRASRPASMVIVDGPGRTSRRRGDQVEHRRGRREAAGPRRARTRTTGK